MIELALELLLLEFDPAPDALGRPTLIDGVALDLLAEPALDRLLMLALELGPTEVRQRPSLVVGSEGKLGRLPARQVAPRGHWARLSGDAGEVIQGRPPPGLPPVE